MVAIGEGPETKALLDFARPFFALYVGGMGARGKNFYNDLACQYGYEQEAKEIQDLYLGGNKRDAEAKVPLEWLEATNLVGPASYVKERLAAYAEAGVTNLMVQPVSDDPAATVRSSRTGWADLLLLGLDEQPDAPAHVELAVVGGVAHGLGIGDLGRTRTSTS